MRISVARLRRNVFIHLDASAWPRSGLSLANRIVVSLILAAVALTVIESEIALQADEWSDTFLNIEVVFTCAFIVEYVLRLWSIVENPKYRHSLKGRLRYLRSPAAVIDLLALSPVLFASIGGEAFLFRLFRLLGILRLAKLGRLSAATAAIAEAIHLRRYELVMTGVIGAFLLLFTSTLLYLVEAEVQPIAFGSIPRAMWWSIATLTTVGYGDVTPITAVGRILAGITALTGIGLIAMPAGILAAAFSDALQRHGKKSQRGVEEEGDQ